MKTLAKTLCEAKLCVSMSEARRLCYGKAVKVNGVTMENPGEMIPQEDMTIEVGKKIKKEIKHEQENKN